MASFLPEMQRTEVEDLSICILPVTTAYYFFRHCFLQSLGSTLDVQLFVLIAQAVYRDDIKNLFSLCSIVVVASQLLFSPMLDYLQ